MSELKRRVLIAGCGYVGGRLAEQLTRAGHHVFGIRRNVSALPKAVTPVKANLADRMSLKAALSAAIESSDGASAPFDWVVYAASADARDEASYRAAYLTGLENVLAVIAPPERLLFTSSTAVFGQTDGSWVDEDSPTTPARFTGEIMLEAEALVAGSAKHASSVRFGGIYGPGRTRLIERVRSGGATLPAGPQWTNRIHQGDCAGSLAHLLEVEAPAPIYIGVDDEPADMRDVYRWLADTLGRFGPACPPPKESTEPAPSMAKRCSNKRLTKSGYSFRYPSYRDGYGAMIAALMSE